MNAAYEKQGKMRDPFLRTKWCRERTAKDRTHKEKKVRNRKGLSRQEQTADEDKTQGVRRWIDGTGVEGEQGQSKKSRATKVRLLESFTSARARCSARQQTRNQRRRPGKHKKRGNASKETKQDRAISSVLPSVDGAS